MNEDNSIVIEKADYDRMIIQTHDYQRLLNRIKNLTRRRPGDYVDIDYNELAKYMMQAVPGFREYVETLEETPWMIGNNEEEKKEEEA